MNKKKKYNFPELSKKCRDLKEKILRKHLNLFKEKLEATDRFRGPPIRLTIDPSKDIRSMNHVKPYDVPYLPYNLRASMDKELFEAISAGVLRPRNEATNCLDTPDVPGAQTGKG